MNWVGSCIRVWLGVLVLLCVVDDSRAQRGGSRGGDKKEEVSDRMRRWADSLFSRHSGGKDVIVLSEYHPKGNPDAHKRLKDFAERNGIRNGQITREQYARYIAERYDRSKKTRNSGGDKDGGSDRMRRYAESLFDKFSGGKDFIVISKYFPKGDLDAHLRLKDFARRNGILSDRVTREQYIRYIADNAAQRKKRREIASLAVDPRMMSPTRPEEPAKRPVVYTAENVPEELRKDHWFTSLDKDGDGQVGLYEWKAAQRSVRDFRAVDVNADGFATAEEALRHLKNTQEPGSSSSRNSRQGSDRSSSSRFSGYRRRRR